MCMGISIAFVQVVCWNRPVKQQITARVDADVLDWLKSEGKGYQGRLNAILRREMLASLKPARRA